MYHVLNNDFPIYYVLYVLSIKISNITSLRTNHPSVHMYLADHASTTSHYQITFDKKKIIGIISEIILANNTSNKYSPRNNLPRRTRIPRLSKDAGEH